MTELAQLSLTTVEASIDAAVGHLRLNQPERGNPLSADSMSEIIAAAQWLEQSPQVKVVVISGNGKSFCNGFDLTTWSEHPSRELAQTMTELGNRLIRTLKTLRPITVVALWGWVVGGGMGILLASDIRVADPDTTLLIPEIRLGLIYGWYGLPLLVNEVGPTVARDLLLTGRKFPAQEALERGVISRIVPTGEVLSASVEIAQQISRHPTMAVQATKRAINDLTWKGVNPRSEDLIQSFLDPESRAQAQQYLRQLGIKPAARHDPLNTDVSPD